MGRRVLHIHEPRIGIGLPARTGRPWPRPGDGVLASFLEALRRPADRIVITGRLFDRAAPPAHLVQRVVEPLADRVRSGTPVSVPAGTPRALLFLAGALAFWETLGGWELEREHDRAVRGTTGDDIVAVARAYFDPETRSSAWLVS